MLPEFLLRLERARGALVRSMKAEERKPSADQVSLVPQSSGGSA